MPIFNFTKTYADTQPLFELDLDNLRESIQTALNVTKLDSDNIAPNGIEADSFEDPGIFIQPGMVMDWPTSSAPSGWLLLNGASVAVATYPNLFAAIGYTYGGAGANFNVPNAFNAVIAGKDNMGGVAANRLTVIAATTLGTTGGNSTIAAHTHGGGDLVGSSAGLHTHTISDAGHDHDTTCGILGPGTHNQLTITGAAPTLNRLAVTANGPTGLTVDSATGLHTHTMSGNTGINNDGSGSASENFQPTIVLNKIIKT